MSDTLASAQLAPEILATLRGHFERAMSAGSPLACMSIAIDRLERCSDVDARERLWHTLTKFLLGHAALAPAHLERSGDRLWMFVPGRSTKDSTALARALVESVRKLRLDSSSAGPTHFTISIGLAVTRPTLCLEAFLQVAEEGLGVARNGGDRAVHTEVYDFIQKKVTGKLLPTAKELTPVLPARAVREVELPALAPRPAAAAAVIAARAPAQHEPTAGALARVDAVPGPTSSTGAATETVELLERRIAKLLRALESAEERIARLEHTPAQIGVASLYREVQGLDPDARFIDAKRQMMTRIFEANLALHGRAAS
jgi:hypothetical protein